MRLVNSGLNVQFTAKHYSDTRGWVIVVTNEDDTELRLDVIPLQEATLIEEDFTQACARWVNTHDAEQIAQLRAEAWGAGQRMRGRHMGATPFEPEIEMQLDEIASAFGRGDVYLGTVREVGRQMYVLGPWLRGLTGDRHFRNGSLTYVLGFIDRAYAKATAADVRPENFRQMRQGELPEGATWVARGAARRAGIDEGRVRVVDVGSIGNGGHVVTWTDQSSGFHVTEDYNNIDIFRS